MTGRKGNLSRSVAGVFLSCTKYFPVALRRTSYVHTGGLLTQSSLYPFTSNSPGMLLKPLEPLGQSAECVYV